MKALATSNEKVRVLKESLLENASYKLVALFISLILWLSILGRRDFVVTKDIDVDFIVAKGHSLAQSTDKVRMKVSGGQSLLKNFRDRMHSTTIDVSDKKSGLYDIEMTPTKFDVPSGIRVLGIRPNTIRVEIIENQETK